MIRLYHADSAIITWWTTRIECDSAIARLIRESSLQPTEAAIAAQKLQTLYQQWQEVAPSESLREIARGLVRTRQLRAADALQLAAALVAAARQPVNLPFVCLDKRLAAVAAAEGFHVITA